MLAGDAMEGVWKTPVIGVDGSGEISGDVSFQISTGSSILILVIDRVAE